LLQGQYVDGDVFALGFDGGAGVPGGNEDFLDPWVLGDFPGQGVFTATAANDQNIHFKNLRETLCFSVGASLLAKIANDDEGKLTPRGVFEFFASKLAPTVEKRCC